MVTLSKEQKRYLLTLAEDARERDGEEWGDERLVVAQTLLEKEVEGQMGKEVHSEWCDLAEGYRMDEEEIIDWIVKKINDTPVSDYLTEFSDN